MPQWTLTINGARHTVDAPASMPLLWMLRDRLGLTGTKFGCGRGVCGACSVLLDGKTVRSCQVRADEVGTKAVTTIEGLAPKGDHPLQRAWIAEDVAQCGYCQPGFIMTAAGLLKAKPRPTDAEIDAAMSDLVCRCGTYARIRKAVRRAAKEVGK